MNDRGLVQVAAPKEPVDERVVALSTMMIRMIFSDIFKNWFLLTTASQSAPINLSERDIRRIICQDVRDNILSTGSKTFERHRYASDKSSIRATALKPDGDRTIILYYVPYRCARAYFYSRTGQHLIAILHSLSPRTR